MNKEERLKAAEAHVSQIKHAITNREEILILSAFEAGAEAEEESNLNWILDKEIPHDLIDSDVAVWMCVDNFVFRGVFYKSYGGLNYRRTDDIDLSEFPIQINAIDKASKVIGYMRIIKPQPLLNQQ